MDTASPAPPAPSAPPATLVAPPAPATVSLPPGITNMSTDDKLNKLLELVFASNANFSALTTRVCSLETAVDYMDSQLITQRESDMAQKEVVAKLEAKVATMEARITGLQIGLAVEAKKRDENENVSRKQCLEFSGIPQSATETPEDVKKLVVKVMQLIGSSNNASCIDDAHRKMGGGIIARFKSREERNEIYLKRFALVGKSSANIGFPVPGTDLYINESLTIDRSRVMKSIRDKLKVLNRGVINKDDRIKVKSSGGVVQVQNLGGKFIKVSSLNDFDRMYPNDIEVEIYS